MMLYLRKWAVLVFDTPPPQLATSVVPHVSCVLEGTCTLIPESLQQTDLVRAHKSKERKWLVIGGGGGRGGVLHQMFW